MSNRKRTVSLRQILANELQAAAREAVAACEQFLATVCADRPTAKMEAAGERASLATGRVAGFAHMGRNARRVS